MYDNPSQSSSPRKSGKQRSSSPENEQGYSSLSITEKWNWHADDYAFRIVVLGDSWEGLSSPCDPKREWFDTGLIRTAVEQKRQKLRARQDWNRKERIEEAQQAEWRRAARLRKERGYRREEPKSPRQIAESA